MTDIQSVDIFKGLSDQELAQIVAIGRSISVPWGTLMARQGDVAPSVYIILEGQAQLTTASPQGEITVRIAGPGESLPLAALLGSGRLITTAYTLTDLRGMEMPRGTFQELIRQHPEIGMKVYQAIADILGERYQNTLTRLVGTVEQAFHLADVFANDMPPGSKTILLVEDEPSVRAMTANILKEQSYTVLEATNGEEALHVAQEQDGKEIHLLLTDIVMPQMDGIELFEQFGSLYPTTRVLLMSGYPDGITTRYGVLDKGARFIPKPFTPTALAQATREVLDY